MMHKEVTVVRPQDKLADVMRLLQPRGIRHLPVIDGEALVGIVSDRDLKGALASWGRQREKRRDSAFEDFPVADIMSRPVVTVAPMFPVEEAALIMVTKRISALPVTDADRLVGIITDTDVLQLFVTAMGVTEPSSRLDVRLSETNSLEGAVRIIADARAPISSIMTLANRTTGVRDAVIRIATINPKPAISALEAHAYKVRESWRGVGKDSRM